MKILTSELMNPTPAVLFLTVQTFLCFLNWAKKLPKCLQNVFLLGDTKEPLMVSVWMLCLFVYFV
jgi:hypothetical protein